MYLQFKNINANIERSIQIAMQSVNIFPPAIVTKSLVNKRHNNDALSNSVTSFSVRVPRILNFRDQ